MPLLDSQPAIQHTGAPLRPGFAALAGIGLGWITALLLMHHPMIFSGFALTQADLGDSRLNNLFLEHSWMVLHQPSTRLWDLPFFYPQPNTAAYSDLMLSFAPFYWCWRLPGLAPDTAFQLWMMTGTSLNFFTALYWLRCCCKIGWGGAISGAVFFAAAGPRATQLGHQQLQWQIFPMLALIAVYTIFQTRKKSFAARAWLMLGLSITAQFWGGFYCGWFLVLGLGLAGMLAIARKPSRGQLANVIRRDAPAILAGALLAGFLLAPLAWHYLAAMANLDGHPYEEVRYRLATPTSWILPGPFSIARAWLSPLMNLPPQKLERAVSLGTVTTLMALGGLWVGRRSTSTSLMALTGLLIVCLGTGLHSRYSLWWIAYNSVPGAEAIRAPVRIGLMLIFPGALGLALMVDQCKHRYRFLLTLGLLVCLFEQAAILPFYNKQQARDRITAITAEVPANARCFFLTGDKTTDSEYAQIDAMWASLLTGVPTLNGYSGSSPPGWDLGEVAVASTGQRQKLENAVKRWAIRSKIDPSQIAWPGADGHHR